MTRKCFKIVALLVIYLFVMSTGSSDELAKYTAASELPASFSSEKELRDKVRVDEWLECKTAEKQFFVCRSQLLSAAMPREWLSCWYADPSGRLVRVWDTRLVNAGPVKIKFDPKTSLLSIVGAANTKFKGKSVASVV